MKPTRLFSALFAILTTLSAGAADNTFDINLKKKAVMVASKRVDLSSDKLYEDNSIEAPANIVPVENGFDGKGQSIQAAINPLSFSVFVLTIE